MASSKHKEYVDKLLKLGKVLGYSVKPSFSKDPQGALEYGLITVSLNHSRSQIVNNQPTYNTSKKLPRLLYPIDQTLQILTVWYTYTDTG